MYLPWFSFWYSLHPQRASGHCIKNITTYIWIFFCCFTHVPIVLISSGIPLSFSMEYSSILHFNLPFHHFNLLLLFDIPSQMHWSGHSVTLFCTASSTALHSAVAFFSFSASFSVLPLTLLSYTIVLFLWLLLPFYERPGLFVSLWGPQYDFCSSVCFSNTLFS